MFSRVFTSKSPEIIPIPIGTETTIFQIFNKKSLPVIFSPDEKIQKTPHFSIIY